MLDLKSMHWLRQSCSTTSCCTLGVAVAVSAISGTAGYLRGQQLIVSQAAGSSCMSGWGQASNVDPHLRLNTLRPL